MARIIVEGSSTAYGLWGGKQGGWADRIKTSILSDENRGQYASLVNLAVPLRTSTEIADDLLANLTRYAGESPARIALFMLGMSESRLRGGNEIVTPDMFRRDIERIIETCQLSGFIPVFIGMTPIDEAKTRQFKGEDVSFLDTRRVIYDDIVRSCVNIHTGVLYVDTVAALMEHSSDVASLIDKDGLHVNSEGHGVIHDLLLPIVRTKILELKKPRSRVAV